MTDEKPVVLSGMQKIASTDVTEVREQILVPNPNTTPALELTTKDLALGGGTGGAIVIIANLLIANPAARTAVQALAPMVAMFLTTIYRWAAGEIAAAYKSRQEEKKRLQLLDQSKQALADTKLQLAAIESDPHASDAHKKEMRETMERIEKEVLKLNVKGILVIDDN